MRSVFVHLSDAQSVLQITIALNLAYFSFKEIRGPVENKIKADVAWINKEIERFERLIATIKEPEVLRPFDERTSIFMACSALSATLRMHRVNSEGLDEPFTDNIVDFDRIFRLLAMSMAILGFAMLFFASCFSNEEIRIRWFLLCTALLLLPPLFSVAYNWSLTSMLQGSLAEIRGIKEALSAMAGQLDDHLLRYRNATRSPPQADSVTKSQ